MKLSPGTVLFQNKILKPSKWSLKEWKYNVPAWIRVYFFFCSGVNSYTVLCQFYKLLSEALEKGWSLSCFVNEALILLEELKRKPASDPDYYQSIELLYNCDRLRRTLEVHDSSIYGYSAFCNNFSNYQLQAYPAFQFFRQAGAKTKREDHVKHEGVIKLKSDIDFWVSMNNETNGGFGLPYEPFGFRSWMRLRKISREQCENTLGFMNLRNNIDLTPAEREKWGLPMKKEEDFRDKERLHVVSELKKWGVWEVRKKVLEFMHQDLNSSIFG